MLRTTPIRRRRPSPPRADERGRRCLRGVLIDSPVP